MTPREELEARLTALLLGELPAEEAASLQQAIARDAELSCLHDRLKQAIGLVRETVTSPEQAALVSPDAPKLSPDRRAALLAAFKVVRPKELTEARRSRFAWRELVAVAAMIVILCLAVAIIAPNFIRARGGASQRPTLYVARDESWAEAAAPATPLARRENGRVPVAGKPGDFDAMGRVDYFADKEPQKDATLTVVLPSSGTVSQDASASPPVSLATEQLSSAFLVRAKPEVRSFSAVADASPPPPLAWAALPTPSPASDAKPSGERPATRLAAIALPASAGDALSTSSEDKNNGWAGRSVIDLNRSQFAEGTFTPDSRSRAGRRSGGGGGAGSDAGTKPAEYAGVSIAGVHRAVGPGAMPGQQIVTPAPSATPTDGSTSVAYGIAPVPAPAGAVADLDVADKRPSLLAAQDDAVQLKGMNLDPGVVVTARFAALDEVRDPAQQDAWQFGVIAAGGAGQTAMVQRAEGMDGANAVAGRLGVPGYLNGGFWRNGGGLGGAKDLKEAEKKSAEPGASILADTEAGKAVRDLQREAGRKADEKSEVAQRAEELVVVRKNGGQQIVLPVVELGEAREKLRVATGPVVISEIMANEPATGLPAQNQRDVQIALEEAYRQAALKGETLRREQMKTVEMAWEAPGRLQSESNKSRSARLENADLARVLERYQELTGRTVLRPDSIPETKITLRNAKPLTREEEIQALDSILSMNGIAMTPQGTKYVKAVREAQAGASAAKANDVPVELLAESGAYVTHVVQLTNTSLDAVQAALQPLAKAPNSILTIPSSGLVVLRDHSENVKRMAELAKRIDAGEKGEESRDAATLARRATAPIPQPEVSTAENLFSTFSINVSDVSFKLAAASLEKGQMPDPATVRSEEFINAFDYRDPEPQGSAPIAFAWERARYPFAHDRDLVRFSVKTAASGRQPGRPLNLVLLLDNSGSMERADRIRIRQECLRVLATQLQSQDRVSVVAFARTARLFVDGLPGNQAGELQQRVGGLAPEGGTNLEDAMNVAYRTALKHFLANGVNRVVLLTDGAANLGDVEPDSLKKKVEAHRRQGVALDCFGIGWDGLNDELLEALSRNGDGRYGFVNTPEAAASEFAGQLAGALKVAASDVKVQVEWNPRRVTAYRQIGYAKHQLKKEQFRDNTVDAAEIGAAEAGNALYTVQVNPRGEGPLGMVRVRFKVPGTSDYREHEWTVPYEGAAKSLNQSTPALRLAASASAFSEWLVSSPFAAEVTLDRLLAGMSGVPEVFPADPRPKKLEWMIRQAKSVAGK
jgi:Mg-chelatase subunit ChlD